jgi:hypothetical protein
MSSGSDLLRRIACRLIRHAASVLPPGRDHWAEAMAAEFDYIPKSAAALQWALGCVLASYSERIRIMTTVRPPVSRWVLILEMLFCFTPITLTFFAIVANFTRFQPMESFLFLSVAALGPVGLAVAFRTIFLNRPSLPKVASWALCALAVWTLLAYSLHVLAESGGAALDWWREFVLIALLPALASVHLIYLARSANAASKV